MTAIRQRASADCGVAALAQLAGVAYEDAYVAVAKIDPAHRGKRGLHNREVIRAASLMKIQLQPTRRFDLDDEGGILRVRGPKMGAGGHFVAVIESVIVCPADGTPRPWREYLEINSARACTLLRDAAQMDRFTGRIDVGARIRLDQIEAYLAFLRRNAGRRIELIAHIDSDLAPDPELPKFVPVTRPVFASTEDDADEDDS